MNNYIIGSDVIAGSMPTSAFDNSKSYNTGDVVTYWGQWWQAVRPVSPPWWPAVMSGDKPGDSDAWRNMSGNEVVNNVLGDDQQLIEALKYASKGKPTPPPKSTAVVSHTKAGIAVVAVLAAAAIGTGVHFIRRKK